MGEPPATACGGNLAGGKLTRNKRSPQCGAATIEAAVIAEAVEEAVEAAAAEEEPGHGEGISVEEISELVGEILDPGASEVIGEEDECDPGREVIPAGDALRAALRAVSPYLAKLPKKQRRRVCADISACLNGKAVGADAGIYAAMAAASQKPAPHPGDLGKHIMATRNANRPRQ